MTLPKFKLGDVLANKTFNTFGVVEEIQLLHTKDGTTIRYTVKCNTLYYNINENDASLMIVAPTDCVQNNATE